MDNARTTCSVPKDITIGGEQRNERVQEVMKERQLEQSLPKQQQRLRPLINPFRLSENDVRLTANRRRWIHVFPLDAQGRAKQGHHYVVGHATIHIQEKVLPAKVTTPGRRAIAESRSSAVEHRAQGLWAWGSTGEEQWNPDMLIYVDWKSLTHTAQLPITTDFFPDGASLAKDYLIREHSVCKCNKSYD